MKTRRLLYASSNSAYRDIYMEIGKGVDPFQFFAALNGKLVSPFHELAISETNFECFEEILPLGEYIDFLVVVGNCLVENESFCAVAHALHYFLLSIYGLIWPFLIDVAFEMVFVIWLPRFRTHIAEIFTTSAGHEVTTHRPLHCLLAPRTNLSVLGNPFSIRLLAHHLLNPLHLLIALARIVVV